MDLKLIGPDDLLNDINGLIRDFETTNSVDIFYDLKPKEQVFLLTMKRKSGTCFMIPMPYDKVTIDNLVEALDVLYLKTKEEENKK